MIRRLALLMMVLLVMNGCADLFDPAAAVVNGDKIPVDEVSAGLDRFEQTQEFERLAAQGDTQSIKRQFEQGYLSQLIRRAVLTPKAEEMDIEVTDEEVQQRIDQLKADFPSDAAFQETLKEQGLDLAQLEQLVADSILEEQIRLEVTADAGPSEEELQRYYEERSDSFEETEVSHILVDSRDLAAVVTKQLKAAPRKELKKTFKRLARDFSTDKATAREGGDLGYTAPGDLVPQFSNAMRRLQVGEISDPVRTEFGWHVILVTDRRIQPFEDVRDRIEEEIGGEAEEEAWTEWVVDAYRDADVRVNPRYGELDLETGQVTDATAEDIPGAEEPSPDISPTATGGG
jgi:parvulin-like peptidyl-prolyl isomerase